MIRLAWYRLSAAFYAGNAQYNNRSAANRHAQSQVGAGSDRVACCAERFAKWNFDRRHVRLHCRRDRPWSYVEF
jgi:hypothetical protein